LTIVTYQFPALAIETQIPSLY